MFKTSAKQLINRKLNLNIGSIHANKSTNNEKSLDQFRTDLSLGPQLSDFIAGVIPREDNWNQYKGKLKREKGDNERFAFNHSFVFNCIDIYL
jgi:hypothetical protein